MEDFSFIFSLFRNLLCSFSFHSFHSRKKMQSQYFCGQVSTRDNRVLKRPLGRSLFSFARTAHSAHLLRSAPLRYARFARSLRSRARSLTSLTPSLDGWNSWICFHTEIAFKGNKRDNCRHWKQTLTITVESRFNGFQDPQQVLSVVCGILFLPI